MGRYTITVCNQPTRLTQPCIPPGSLNRVLASAGGKGWNVTSAGWQVTLCDPIWHVSSSSGEACCELLYPVTLLYLLLIMVLQPTVRLPCVIYCMSSSLRGPADEAVGTVELCEATQVAPHHISRGSVIDCNCLLYKAHWTRARLLLSALHRRHVRFSFISQLYFMVA